MKGSGVGFIRKLELVLFLVIFITGCFPDPRLSEESLRNQFNKNEATLNRLVGMAHEDKDFVFVMPKNDTLKGGDYRWTREKTGFSETHRGEYRALLASAGIEGGMSAFKGNVDFDVHAFISGIGFLYTETQLPKDAQVVHSRNKCVFDKGQRKCFIYLTKNWYMSFGTS